MEEAIKRISASLNSGECYPDLYNMTIAKSFLFSVVRHIYCGQSISTTLLT